MSTLERVLLHAHTVDVGVDDKRRTFPLPREGLQPCVAPYFATRGRGDMRGGRGGVPPKSHPGGGARLSLPPTCCVQRAVYHGVARRVVWCDNGLPPPPGWHLCGWCWRSPHVADTPVGEIRGYAQRQPLAGWRKCPPPVIVSTGGGWRTRLLKLWHKKRDAEAPLCFRTL